MSRPWGYVAYMLGITVSDGIAGALIGASAALPAGVVERQALRAAARRDRLQHAVTPLTTESLVLMADLGVFGTAVFRKSIWYHIIGVPDARRIQRQSLRVVAEARSDLALVTRKTPILAAADHLLDAVGPESCLSLVWAVLDRAARGWRGAQMNPVATRLLAELRRELFAKKKEAKRKVVARAA